MEYQTVRHLITANFPLAIFYIAMGALGITFAVACLCFDFAFRKNPLVKKKYYVD